MHKKKCIFANSMLGPIEVYFVRSMIMPDSCMGCLSVSECSHGAHTAQVGRDGSERRASAVAASTVWRRDTGEDTTAGENFQRPGREAPKPRTKRRATSAGDAGDAEGAHCCDA